MSSSETASVLKRKFDDVADDDESVASRCETKKQLPKSTIRSSSFLPHHLKMLRALYVDSTVESYQSSNVTTSGLTDGAVSGEVWDMIQRFLEGRHELHRIKNEAQRYRAIVNASKDHVEQQQPSAASNKNAITTSKSPMMWQPTSPLEKRLFASPYAASSTSAKSKSAPSSASSGSSFGLVSKLLERRACVAENEARKVVHPFYELYTAVCKRAERLDSLLESSNEEEEEERSTPVVLNNEDSNESEVDAKNKLWKMLANDLYNVIKV
jgi:hypothetical protein